MSASITAAGNTGREEKERVQTQNRLLARARRRLTKAMKTELPEKPTLEDMEAVGVDVQAEGLVVDMLVRARHVRLLPTIAQKKYLLRCFGVARKIYNQCVAAYRNGETVNQKALRERFVNDSCIPESESFKREVPYEVRDGAVKDFLEALKACKAKARLARERGELPRHFKLHFRSLKRMEIQSVAARPVNFKAAGDQGVVFYPRRCPDDGKLRTREPVPVFQADGRLLRDKKGKYFLSVVERKPRPCSGDGNGGESQGENQTQDGAARDVRICSVDPGVRSFLTVYDPTAEEAFRVADGDIARVYRIGRHLDRLESKISNAEDHRSRRKMRIAAARMRSRIQNLVREVHWKVANWLVHRYDVVVIPWFDSSGMVAKTNARGLARSIGRKTVRNMLSWSHGKFRERLACKAEEVGCTVVFVTEPYTSKTCGGCGTVRSRPGFFKQFSCKACGYRADRDVNGARNILLRSCCA